MSSCLSGGGRAAYGFDLEIVKPPSSTSITRAASHSTPSPSSTLSESNSTLTISTRKARTPRKRPNQTYNEAAALLSTVYPNIFSAKNLSTKRNSSSQLIGVKWTDHSGYLDESSDLLLPFGNATHESDLLFHPPIQGKSDLFSEPKEVGFDGRGVITWEVDDSEANQAVLSDDFDAESILEEEAEEGIDSIMGKVESNNDVDHKNGESRVHESSLDGDYFGMGRLGQMMMNSWYGNPMRIGLGGNFELGFGNLRGALRQNDDANWWRFPTVDLDQISPRCHNKKKVASAADKKKKVEKRRPPTAAADSKCSGSSKEDPDPNPETRSGLLLKLNYDSVLEAWSDAASPFADAAGTDIHARLAQMDLLGERDTTWCRNKDKRRTRLVSDQRSRLKGRFARGLNATDARAQR